MGEYSTDSQATTALLDRASAGDLLAVDELMSRHVDKLKNTVRRRLNPQLRPRVDPSDVVQETQHDAFRRLDDYLQRRPMPFRLWLLRTAHERLLDIERRHLRAAKRAIDREVPFPDASSIQLAAQMVARGGRPIDDAARREIAAKVRRSLSQLADKDREILLLRCFESLDNREVATLLELNHETTKKRFVRALVRLQDLLKLAGVTEALS